MYICMYCYYKKMKIREVQKPIALLNVSVCPYRVPLSTFLIE